MKIGTRIENFRKKNNLPVYAMCNILGITTEKEYYNICTGRTELTTCQKCIFIIQTSHPL